MWNVSDAGEEWVKLVCVRVWSRKQAFAHGGMFSSIKNFLKLRNLMKAICKNKANSGHNIKGSIPM